jgi:ribonuclease HI
MVLIHRASSQALERAGGEAQTTNNRMEMQGAIEALSSIRQDSVEVLICTDSRYLIDCCSKWLAGWKARGWTRRDGELKNVDLLQKLDALLQRHRVAWHWVAGHSGEPGNERADALANLAMDALTRGDAPEFERRTAWADRLPSGNQ